MTDGEWGHEEAQDFLRGIKKALSEASMSEGCPYTDKQIIVYLWSLWQSDPLWRTGMLAWMRDPPPSGQAADQAFDGILRDIASRESWAKPQLVEPDFFDSNDEVNG